MGTDLSQSSCKSLYLSINKPYHIMVYLDGIGGDRTHNLICMRILNPSFVAFAVLEVLPFKIQHNKLSDLLYRLKSQSLSVGVGLEGKSTNNNCDWDSGRGTRTLMVIQPFDLKSNACYQFRHSAM